MGFSEKTQVEGGFDSDYNRKWIIAGVALRAPLKPINIKPVAVGDHLNLKAVADGGANVDDDDECPTTPKGEGARIPTNLACPPAPMKRKSCSKCNSSGRVREFFTPSDLETVFLRHV